MIRLSRSLLLFLLVFAASAARADDVASVRIQAADEEAVWVGEKAAVYLELWTRQLSFADQSFALPEAEGGFLMQPDSTTVKLTERRGSETWQGLRYYLALYPQRAGQIEIPPFEVRFSTLEGFGSESQDHVFRTEPVSVAARMPPGATPGSLLVSTRDFRLRGGWEPAPADEDGLELKTGDALVLELRREAAEVPGMVFAPLPEPDIDGLGVYVDTPSVDDRISRGQLTGSRTDRITLVCERPGRYSLPEFRFQWWDPGSERLHEEVVPALTLDVVQNPAWAAAASGDQRDWISNPDWRWLWLPVAALLAWWPVWPLSRALVAWLAKELGARRLVPLNPGSD